MRSNYAGMRLGAVNHSFTDRDAGEQNVIMERVLKTWTEERKTLLRKYKQNIITLQRRADGINEWLETKGPISREEITKIEGEYNARCTEANDMLKALVADYADRMVKAGVTTSTGYVGYRLDGPAYLIYPMNTPLRNQLARWGLPAGKMGSTLIHWMYTGTGPSAGSGSYIYGGAAEGKRVGESKPDKNDGVCAYKELGVERSVSFTAEFAAEGYTDNVADEHIRGLHQLWLQEESMILGGNAGTGSNQNGFALGTANTPTMETAASIPAGAPSDGSTAGFSGTPNVSVRVVELTMLGYPNNGQYGYQAAPTVGATGLVPSYSRTDAGPYSDSDTINGGMGAVSAASNVLPTVAAYARAKVVAKKGAVAWAWFVNDQDAATPTTALSYLAAITTVPYCYFGVNSAHTAISGNEAASATNLNADKSANTLDFTGMLGWAAAAGTWINMSDITKTDPSMSATNDGLLEPVTAGSTTTAAITQVEYDLAAQFTAYQTVADEIWCDPIAKAYFNQAIMAGGANAYRFETTRDGQGNILGGAVVTGYKSVFGMKANGADEIALRLHPMLPTGTILYRKTQNPYPHDRIPGVSGIATQRDYYGIEWPINKRQWEFGTYVHEAYIDYIPGLLTVRTGIQGVS